MSFWNSSLLPDSLLKRTPIFGLRLITVIVLTIAASTLLFLAVFLAILLRRRRSRRLLLPPASSSSSRKPLNVYIHDISLPSSQEIIQIPVEIRQEDGPIQSSSDSTPSLDGYGEPSLVSSLGWGQHYTLQELDAATGDFAGENVIAEGGYGVVYRAVLADNTNVAIKNLLNYRDQVENEFKVEVEALGRVRHKNLVRLLGYCVEGFNRMLVYEYIDNGNLDQWLHGNSGKVSPLTWEIRMRIVLGTAKGLAYLHEGLEPKVVHRDVKSSSILLDKQWNAKLAGFGLAKLLNSQKSHVTTRVMGTFGYVAPEYAGTGMLNERSDVYSFGVLVMEVITGRIPMDYSRPRGEVNLIEWSKKMIGERRFEEVVDPKMPEKPSSKLLKRALLIALRCLDIDVHKRPKMGHVVHMLETDVLLSRELLLMDLSRPISPKQ